MKSTAIAPSNIAFIKYWGRKDEELKLPSNGSISMNLSGLTSTTTVEFSSTYNEDEIILDGVMETRENAEKIYKHIARVRSLAGFDLKAKIVSKNTFPRGTGLSSSASGFAALTLAASTAAGLQLSEKELSILARHGSGSACRSIPDGFVEWLDADTSEESYAISLYKQDYWDIVDIVCILTDQVKDVSTTEGQKLANTSLFFPVRQQQVKEKIEKIKKVLAEKDFQIFGEIVEAEALELHAVMLTSTPSLIYWYPATITIMKAVQKWRREGLSVYFTLNTGQNVHVICQKNDQQEVSLRLSRMQEVKSTIACMPTVGAHRVSADLF